MEELRLIEAEIGRFCARTIEPRASRPEAPMAHEDVRAILADASELGLIASDEPGAGLWDDLDEAPSRTLKVLARLARANAAVAWAAHVTSLARVVARRLGLGVPGVGVIVLEGRHGIGRDALARFLVGAAAEDGDAALLADVYGLSGSRLASVPERFDWLVVPFAKDGALHWSRIARDAAHIEVRAHAHGLDELVTIELHGGSVTSVSMHEASARELFASALGAYSLAAMAIALGATERAITIARDYARLRKQGGSVIERHDAVRMLLGRAEGAVASVSAMLDGVARAPTTAAALPRILGLRSHAQPALCGAANDAMQILGGVGYMRDAGIEKIVRDVNHLRATCGTPAELRLVVGEWGRHVS